jgi:2-polyprenyl-6-methoxyphenol hydroxylase-like FAD-dependent oxidoreductase
VREDQQVVGLIESRRGDRVTGVRTTDRHRKIETVSADLVVDASGAGSPLPALLRRLRNGARLRLARAVVKPEVQYVSRWFRLDPADAPDWRLLAIAPGEGGSPRGAMMLRAEDELWGVVLLAAAGVPLPSNDTTFIDFAAGLGGGKLREALAGAQPVSRIHRYGLIANRMTHYERVAAWPAGLVALGDSACALDPYFGLGMTLAARAAVLLASHLDRKGDCPAACLEFQEELSLLNSDPWQLTTGCDPDGRPLGRDECGLRRPCEAAPASPKGEHALLAAQHLLRPATDLRKVGAS